MSKLQPKCLVTPALKRTIIRSQVSFSLLVLHLDTTVKLPNRKRRGENQIFLNYWITSRNHTPVWELFLLCIQHVRNQFWFPLIFWFRRTDHPPPSATKKNSFFRLWQHWGLSASKESHGPADSFTEWRLKFCSFQFWIALTPTFIFWVTHDDRVIECCINICSLNTVCRSMSTQLVFYLNSAHIFSNSF